MCGLVGEIGPGAISAPRDFSEAVNAIGHRGPDDEATASGVGWQLGFRRLAIQDLSESGRQPMWTPECDAVMVFNGEIYNFRDLARQLDEPLRSTGDAEVFLRLLRKEGAAALSRLNGMFAVAFLDLRRRRFLIARDRLGVKPLYFSQSPGSLRFASELGALVRRGRSSEDIDQNSLSQYMTFGHIPPPSTIWRGVSKLRPGEVMEGPMDSPEAASPRSWWQLSQLEVSTTKAADRWIEEIDATLQDATSLRLMADVPVGVFLSAGIDSSLVASYAAAAPTGPSVALTVDFSEPGFSEADTASDTASQLGIAHRRVHLKPLDLSSLPVIASHFGEPFADSSALNTYALSAVAREFAKVFLTGDGGDEAFAGYDEYGRFAQNGLAYSALSLFGGSILGILQKTAAPDSMWLQRASKLSAGPRRFPALIRQNLRDKVWTAPFNPNWVSDREAIEAPLWQSWSLTQGLPTVTRLQRLDYQMYLESDVLVKVDRMTMAHSLEARSPFLDYRVVELAAAVPPALHQGANGGKELLRRIASRRLSGGLERRRKSGFGVPVGEWLARGLDRKIESLLLSSNRPWWSSSGIKTLFEWHRRGARDLHMAIWRLLMLEMWARVFLDGNLEPLTLG